MFQYSRSMSGGMCGIEHRSGDFVDTWVSDATAGTQNPDEQCSELRLDEMTIRRAAVKHKGHFFHR